MRRSADEKLHGKKRQEFVALMEEFIGGSTVSSKIPLHQLLITSKDPGRERVEARLHTVLCDTMASASLMPQSTADKLGILYTVDDNVTVRGADSNKIMITGVGYTFLHDPACSHYKKLRIIVTVQGSYTLISCNDLKNLHLLHPQFPEFIGQGAARRDYKGERKDCVDSNADNAHQATLHTHGSQGEAHTEHLPAIQKIISAIEAESGDLETPEYESEDLQNGLFEIRCAKEDSPFIPEMAC